MLKNNRLRLEFPPGSNAQERVKLAQVRPLIDYNHISAGVVHAISPAVQALDEFEAMNEKLGAPPKDVPDSLQNMETCTLDYDETFGLVKVAKNSYIATAHVAFAGLGDETYEVDKIRKKELRLFSPKAKIVKEKGFKTDFTDSWIQRVSKVFRI